ncbi:MAG: hydrolase [Spirochaetes bacterium]|nr:MAG: hydrolase [Spirochaetota bacterium]
MLTRKEATELLDKWVSTDTLKKHSLATAAVMESMAEKLGEDRDHWWVVGLLHDLDYDLTQDPAEHGKKSEEILSNKDFPEEYTRAIKAHNAEGLGLERKTKLDFALTCSETVTGLIVATALVMPDKKLASVKPSSPIKRMKKKDFARNVSRERILECEKIGMDINSFMETALNAMKKISDQLDL